MGVRFACHACGKRLNIKTELAGKRGICPACSARFRIPPYDTEVSTPLESTPIESEEPMSVSALGSVSEAQVSSAQVGNSTVSRESAASQDFGGVALQDSPQTQQAADSVGDVAEPAAPPSPQATLQDVLGDASATWYVRPPGGGQYGPADGPTMGQWMKEGRVADLAMVWRDGWTDWRVAKDAIPGVVPAARDHAVRDHVEPSASSDHVPSNAPVTGEVTASQPSTLELTARPGPLGSNKQKRSRKRVVASIALGLVFCCLIGALVFVLTRS